MANEYGVFNQGTIVLEYWSGEIGLQEMLDHEREQSQDPSLKEGSVVIADCRDAVFSLTEPELRAICQSTLSRVGYQQKKVAIVINPHTWDIAHNYSAHFWGSSNDVLCFHSHQAACAWLELDSANVQKRLMNLKQVCLT
jgi:hypothetical protein